MDISAYRYPYSPKKESNSSLSEEKPDSKKNVEKNPSHEWQNVRTNGHIQQIEKEHVS